MANILYNEDKINVPIKYEFITNNTRPELIQQYFSLRQQIYTDYWSLKNFSGGKDKYDDKAHILILKQGVNCIGGIRLISSFDTIILPSETENFKFVDIFPDLNLSDCLYGEICRGVMLPEFMNGNYSKEMYRNIAIKSKELGHKYAFAVATVVHARKTRIACKSFGLRVDICEDIKIPDLPTYEGLEMRLMIIHIGDWNI